MYRAVNMDEYIDYYGIDDAIDNVHVAPNYYDSSDVYSNGYSDEQPYEDEDHYNDHEDNYHGYNHIPNSGPIGPDQIWKNTMTIPHYILTANVDDVKVPTNFQKFIDKLKFYKEDKGSKELTTLIKNIVQNENEFSFVLPLPPDFKNKILENTFYKKNDVLLRIKNEVLTIFEFKCGHIKYWVKCYSQSKTALDKHQNDLEAIFDEQSGAIKTIIEAQTLEHKIDQLVEKFQKFRNEWRKKAACNRTNYEICQIKDVPDYIGYCRRIIRSFKDCFTQKSRLKEYKDFKEASEIVFKTDNRTKTEILKDNNLFDNKNYLTSIKTHLVDCNRYSEKFNKRQRNLYLWDRTSNEHNNAPTPIFINKNEICKIKLDKLEIPKRINGKMRHEEYEIYLVSSTNGTKEVGYVRPQVAAFLKTIQEDYQEFNINFKVYYKGDYKVGQQKIFDNFSKNYYVYKKGQNEKKEEEISKRRTRHTKIEPPEIHPSDEESIKTSKSDNEEEYHSKPKSRLNTTEEYSPDKNASSPENYKNKEESPQKQGKMMGTVYECPIYIDIFATSKDTRVDGAVDANYRLSAKSRNNKNPKPKVVSRNALVDIDKKVEKKLMKNLRLWDETIEIEDCIERILDPNLVKEQDLIIKLEKNYFSNVKFGFKNVEICEKNDEMFKYQPKIMTAKLKQHQLHGLSWLLGKEAGVKCSSKDLDKISKGKFEFSDLMLPPFWHKIKSFMKDDYYINILDRTTTFTKPEHIRGGILADDMGLGKTIQILALIASDKEYDSIAFINNVDKTDFKDSKMIKYYASSDEESSENKITKSKKRKMSSKNLSLKKSVTRSSKRLKTKQPAKKQKPSICPTSGIKWNFSDSSKSSLSGSESSGLDKSFSKLSTGTPNNNIFKFNFNINKDKIQQFKSDKINSKCTLIVVPLAVVGNWFDQIDEHFLPETIKAFKYYGDKRRELSEAFLESKDVVVTSYQTIAGDFKFQTQSKIKNPQNKHNNLSIFNINWHRLVLDEGHNIKDSTTLQAKACFSIKAKNKWFLTGTPIQNNMSDFYSIMVFLGIKPLDRRTMFRRFIENPFKRDNLTAEISTRINQLCNGIMLRRMKKEGFLNLPKRTIIKKKVTFTSEEALQYDTLRSGTLLKFTKLGLDAESDIKTLLKSYLSILGSLSKLRQACNSSNLVKADMNKMDEIKQQVEKAGAMKYIEKKKKKRGAGGSRGKINIEESNIEEIRHLEEVIQAAFNEKQDLNCRVCCSAIEESNAGITFCQHPGCYECLLEIGERYGNCPTCHTQIRPGRVVKMPIRKEDDNVSCWLFKDGDTESSSDDGEELDKREELSLKWSSKLKGIVELAERHFRNGKNGKLVIVSQFTGFLLEVKRALILLRDNYSCIYFTGATSEEKRREMIKEFNAKVGKNTKHVMLLSLGAGCVGINLTSANSMIISEPNWNPGREAQCMDRIYRIGQERPVTIYKLYVYGSIECQMLKLQKLKRNIMEVACSGQDGKTESEGLDNNDRKVVQLQAILGHIMEMGDKDEYNNEDVADEIEIDEFNEIVK